MNAWLITPLTFRSWCYFFGTMLRGIAVTFLWNCAYDRLALLPFSQTPLTFRSLCYFFSTTLRDIAVIFLRNYEKGISKHSCYDYH